MRRWTVLIISVAIVAIGFFSLGVAAEEVLTFGAEKKITTLDPAVGQNVENNQSIIEICETLIRYDPKDFSLVPFVAESWTVASDGLSIVFKIRQGMKFHDGTVVNAEAVKYSFDRMIAIAAAPAGMFSMVSECQVLDEYTVKFASPAKYAFWEDAFASNNGFRVVSPTFVRANATGSDPWAKDYLAQHACGSGPYMLQEYVPGQYLVLTKFPDYWKGWRPNSFDKVVIKIMLEPATRLAALQNGDIDLAESVPSDAVPTLQNDPRFTVLIVESGSIQDFYMKCASGPLANKNLRKAVTYAIDYVSVRKCLTGALPACGPLPGWLLGADATLPCVNTQDLVKAQQYMTLSGYKPGELEFNFTIVAGNDWHASSALIIQQSLAQIGIKVNIVPKPWAQLASDAMAGTTANDFYQAYGPSASPDPYELLRSNYSNFSLDDPNYGWNTGYRNDEIQALLDRAAGETNRTTRAGYYSTISGILVEDCPVAFLFVVPYTSTFRSNIKGVEPHRLYRSQYYFYDLWRE